MRFPGLPKRDSPSMLGMGLLGAVLIIGSVISLLAESAVRAVARDRGDPR